MKESEKNVEILEDNFCRFQTAMVEIRYSNARADIENSNASAQEYKILSLNLMDEVSRENEENKNSVSNVVERWVTELQTRFWQEDVIEFCRARNDIARAYEVHRENEQMFIIVMDDSAIDDNVLSYNDFGFEMLEKYVDISDFMVLDVITACGIEYMFDEVNMIYERG